MICTNCGYEQGYDWKGNEYIEINPTGEKFINIKGTFMIDNDNGYSSREVYLYACPICKLIQLKN